MTTFIRGKFERLLFRLLYSDPKVRARIQTFGINVVPTNFYSSVPTIHEIETSYEYTCSEPPYADSGVFRADLLQQTLKRLLEFSPEFAPQLQDDENHPRAFFWKNSQFSFGDAMAYYAFIRSIRPRTIVEIGSGFSTLVAMAGVEKNGYGAVHCVEPYPRPFLQDEPRITLRRIKGQDVEAEFLNDLLRDNDILFIDSTHTVKTGSDCLHLHLRVLPKIRRHIYVHVHDVFLPFGMPKEWLLGQQLYWTEQYLVLAFLTDNLKANVLYSSAYNTYLYESLMRELMGGKYPIGGSSLWFEYDGASDSDSR